MIRTTEDGTTADKEADRKVITETIIIPLTTAITPTKPGTELPDTANRLIRLTANTKDRLAPTPIGARARIVKTDALLDSGSLAGDFINAETLQILGGTQHLRRANETIIVCSGLDNKCLESNVVIDVTIKFDVGEVTHKINIPVRMSNDSPQIGRASCRERVLMPV